MMKKTLAKAIPLWMVCIIVLNSTMAVGFLEYYIMKRNFNTYIADLSKTVKNSNEMMQILTQKVLPQKGYILTIQWRDIGKKLLDTGTIDKTKYQQLFASEPESQKHMWHLVNVSKDYMTINEKNAHFMVNTLWAAGLVNKSKILDEGSMKENSRGNMMGYASTGGWTLGSKTANELFSSESIISLTQEQEELVKKIAQNIFRPCCNNPTDFPDCNHGMAALGYIEIAVKQGVSEKQIYNEVLMLNAFWFPQNYVDLALYMETQGTAWENVDAKKALSAQYSSARGMDNIQQTIQNVPRIATQKGGCAA